jgi:uncharacterized protein YifN (PemK superfamily)
MTRIPDPFPGLVINYSYLWRKDYLTGQEEGVKDRPCAIVLSKKIEGNDTVVTVAAITHTEPEDPNMAVEIPLKVKEYLKLDTERSWIVCTEVNRFVWPGPDIRPIVRQGDKKYSYGVLPPKLFSKVTKTLVRSLVKIVRRTA